MEFKHNPFAGQLEIVATMRDRQIQASIDELRRRDELTVALRSAHKSGVSVDELSDASGLTPKEIRARLDSELTFGEDLDSLAGLR